MLNLEEQIYVFNGVSKFSLHEFLRLIKTKYVDLSNFDRLNNLHPQLVDYINLKFETTEKLTINDAKFEEHSKKRVLLFSLFNIEEIINSYNNINLLAQDTILDCTYKLKVISDNSFVFPNSFSYQSHLVGKLYYMEVESKTGVSYFFVNKTKVELFKSNIISYLIPYDIAVNSDKVINFEIVYIDKNYSCVKLTKFNINQVLKLLIPGKKIINHSCFNSTNLKNSMLIPLRNENFFLILNGNNSQSNIFLNLNSDKEYNPFKEILKII